MLSSLTNKLGDMPGGDTLKQKMSEALDKVIADKKPQIADIIKNKIGPEGLDITNNDETVRKAAGLLYQLLPAPIRMVVSEEKFAVFVLENRGPIMEKLKACV